MVLNSIASYIFFSDKLIHMPPDQRKGIFFLRFPGFLRFFKTADFVIRRVFVSLRWKKHVMAVPLEWYLWNFVRKRILKLF